MKTILFAAAAIIFSGLACADVPAGPDSVNGSFVRMLKHGPGVAPMSATGGDSTHLQFERWVNAAARGDTTRLEAGFANLLARADDPPPALRAHGMRDPIEVMITQALQRQMRATSIAGGASGKLHCSAPIEASRRRGTREFLSRKA